MKSKRWNFEASESSLMVCRDNHDKGDSCEYEFLSPAETLELLEGWRQKAIRFHLALEQIVATSNDAHNGFESEYWRVLEIAQKSLESV